MLHSSTQLKTQVNKITTLLLKENWTDNLLLLNINIIFIQFYAAESDIIVAVVFD